MAKAGDPRKGRAACGTPALQIPVTTAGSTGVAEWATKSVNCITGCSHNCRYCYAAHNACDRWHRIKREEWEHPKVRDHDVRKRHGKYGGRVMFPSTHDITPELLEPCMQVLGNLLWAGNEVLVVSKPHLECIKRICTDFGDHRGRILFRFTIGADDPALLQYWEPGAPPFDERLACLRHAKAQGFATSVSMEPMLDIVHAPRLVRKLLPFITETVWLGKMNAVSSRVRVETDEDRRQADAVIASQTDEAVWALYDEMKDIPQVRWKDSIKKVVGIPIEKAPSDSTSPPASQPPLVDVTEFPNHVTVTAAATASLDKPVTEFPNYVTVIVAATTSPDKPATEFPNHVTVIAAGASQGKQIQVVDALAAIGHPKRLRIVMALARAGGAMGFTDLRTALGLRAVTLSQQLDELESAEIARRVRDGRTVTCHLNAQIVNEIGTYLCEIARTAPPLHRRRGE